mmetsp:Transcript_30845/g.83573  ORF Transcript_30845/g.83573 Transcript_30845/m.83573 type:complete len:104 (-) Transcript_30845:83-394(-)
MACSAHSVGLTTYTMSDASALDKCSGDHRERFSRQYGEEKLCQVLGNAAGAVPPAGKRGRYEGGDFIAGAGDVAIAEYRGSSSKQDSRGNLNNVIDLSVPATV